MKNGAQTRRLKIPIVAEWRQHSRTEVSQSIDVAIGVAVSTDHPDGDISSLLNQADRGPILGEEKWPESCGAQNTRYTHSEKAALNCCRRLAGVWSDCGPIAVL